MGVVIKQTYRGTLLKQTFFHIFEKDFHRNPAHNVKFKPKCDVM